MFAVRAYLLLALAAFASISQAVISDELHGQILLYNQYCGAVYCKSNNDLSVKPGTKLKCKTATCPLVEANNATVVATMTDLIFSSVAIIAKDPVTKTLVLVFRGGQNIGLLWGGVQWLTGCNNICPKCQCNYGPYSAWQIFRNQVLPAFAAARAKYPTYASVVTGYSIGASFAVYAAAELRNNGTNVTMYNFGQQRSGDANFANYITAQGNNFRVTHTDDPIPRQQGDPAQGYRHISPEYWAYKDNGAAHNYSVNATNIKMIIGINNNTGCGSGKGTNEPAHDRYFQEQMSICLGNFSIGLTTVGKRNIKLRDDLQL